MTIHPILHCKDQYILEDYPQYNKFAKLTQQETHWELLDRPKTITHQNEWKQCLEV